MVDLLGPGDAGASPTLSTTTDVTTPTAGDTWYNDCPAGVVDASATPIVSKWLNWMMQQMRVSIRASGVPLANSYDNMLSWAMQSGATNWIGAAGGSANALTGAADNNPIAVEAGTCIFGLASATNTGATTFSWSSLGADPVRDAAGNALTGGELVNGDIFGVCRVASHWRLITPMPLSWLMPQLSQIDVQTFDASGTWTKPAGFAAASLVMVEMWGGGAGGSTGIGGDGAAYERFYFYLGQLPGSCSVVIGAGGLGSDNSSGAANLATEGGKTFFAYGLYSNCFVADGGAVINAISTGTSARFVTSYVGNGGRGGNAVAMTSNGGNGIYGSAGGAGAGGPGVPGTSVFGGAGGAYGSGVGSVPGGGGGSSGSGAPGGVGGHGRCIVTTIQA